MLWNMLSWILDWTTGQKMLFEWCVYTVYLKLIGLHISICFFVFCVPSPHNTTTSSSLYRLINVLKATIYIANNIIPRFMTMTAFQSVYIFTAAFFFHLLCNKFLTHTNNLMDICVGFFSWKIIFEATHHNDNDVFPSF